MSDNDGLPIKENADGIKPKTDDIRQERNVSVQRIELPIGDADGIKPKTNDNQKEQKVSAQSVKLPINGNVSAVKPKIEDNTEQEKQACTYGIKLPINGNVSAIKPKTNNSEQKNGANAYMLELAINGNIGAVRHKAEDDEQNQNMSAYVAGLPTDSIKSKIDNEEQNISVTEFPIDGHVNAVNSETDDTKQEQNVSAYMAETTTGTKCVDSSEAGTKEKFKLDAIKLKKLKTHKNCRLCHKKLGPTSIKCRCGNTYCATHRYHNEHNCPFDYKALGRQEMLKKNPKVVAEKVTKI